MASSMRRRSSSSERNADEIRAPHHLAGNQTAQYVSLRLVIPEWDCERNAWERTAEKIVQGIKVQKFNRFRVAKCRLVGHSGIELFALASLRPSRSFANSPIPKWPGVTGPYFVIYVLLYVIVFSVCANF